MRCKSILLSLFLFPSLAVAQYNSTNGLFKVDEKKGCAPFIVNITTFTGNFDPTWGDGQSGPHGGTVHTYTKAGTYNLFMQYTSNFGSDNITITVVDNTPPDFDIYTCGGQEVQVSVPDTNYDSYFINYGDGSPEVQVPVGILAKDNYTYGAGGLNTISVRGKNNNAADNCTAAQNTVVVVNALTAPFIDLLTVATTTQIDLDFTGSDDVFYKVEIATNSSAPATFQLAQSIHDVDTATISSLRTDDKYYCFRISSFDPCNSTNTYSNIICSADFDAVAQNNQNYITWVTSGAGVASFDMDRDGTTLPSVTTPLTDPSICKTDSCYQLTTNYTNGSQSISLQKCVTAFSTNIPTAITDVTAVVGSGSVDLTWQQDPAFQPKEYSVFRKSGSGSFSLLSKTSSTLFTDGGYSTNGSFCYQINYLDICDNVSPTGIEACPIRLTYQLTNDNVIRLDWSDYTGWTNGVNEYIIEKYDGEGVALQILNVGSATSYEDDVYDPNNQVYVYVITANPNNAGLGQAISNEITVIKEPNLFYPTAFTPNGDNLNDTFKVFGQFIVKIEMNIFNRWGELLFNTNDLAREWDGKYNGNLQPEGTYTFTANLTDLSGRTFKRSGSVVLLNKK